MRYRLGSFHRRPGSSDFARYLHDDQFSAPLTRALEAMLRVRLSRPSQVDRGEATVEACTDLLQVLDPGHPDRGWVHEAHDHLLALERGGLRMRLLACEFDPGPDGFLTLAGSAPEITLEVFPGDAMQIGFAAERNALEPVRVSRRLLREVCWNGSLVCFSELGGRVGATGIGEAIDRCFSPSEYETTVQTLRAARATTVEDPRARLDEMQRYVADSGFPTTAVDEIERRFLGDDDDSLYGLFNAVTSTARDLPDWRARLDLEELAGHLTRPRRPVPSRSGGGVLIPA